MIKTKLEFICNKCNASHLKWVGQCTNCKSWNSLTELTVPKNKSKISSLDDLQSSKIQNLFSVKTKNKSRITTGSKELDRTLGGGLVKGSIVLIGGSPGIGKSTLILQTVAFINRKDKTLYVSGEESIEQITERAIRLGVNSDILLLSETYLEKIIELAKKIKPKVMVIDSIQTMATDLSDSAPGSTSQVRDCAAQFTQFAKKTNCILLMIGHVTKDGALAGPRILEHMVDTVLYFEGDPSGRYRVIRAVKNRFGTINEISIFAMQENGLKQITNPSAIFLSNQNKPSSGSMITVIREATRPIIIEIQALVDHASEHVKRVCLGLDYNRLTMQLAVLHKHGGIATYNKDVFINIVGGIKVNETASDLSIIFAIVSSIKNIIIPKTWIVFGEVGLTGEIRPVYNALERLKEAKKHGFKLAIIPYANKPKKDLKDFKIIAVEDLYQALQYMLKNSITIKK
jgi:DNA repair protein RadA/Sms